MRIFGRKTKAEEEAKEEEKKDKGAVEKPMRTRTPKNKEPEKKPWGKGERYLVVIVLLSTVVASGILALSARSWKLPNLPRVRLPQEALSETYTVERAAPQNTPAEATIEAFTQATKGLSGIYGFYIYDLTTGASYGVHHEEEFQAASLIKLPVLAALYMESEAHRIQLTSEYSLEAADIVGGSGSLQYAEVGSVYTFGELAEYMGKQSDNTAFNVVRNRLGDKKIESVIDTLGMHETSLLENTTTPADVGRFFKKLWEARLLSRESRNAILAHITDTIYENHLAAGIPEGVAVAHKYGREVHVVNDAGIVLTDDPFVLVIMSKGVVEKEADSVFPELADLLYKHQSGEVN